MKQYVFVCIYNMYVLYVCMLVRMYGCVSLKVYSEKHIMTFCHLAKLLCEVSPMYLQQTHKH